MNERVRDWLRVCNYLHLLEHRCQTPGLRAKTGLHLVLCGLQDHFIIHWPSHFSNLWRVSRKLFSETLTLIKSQLPLPNQKSIIPEKKRFFLSVDWSNIFDVIYFHCLRGIHMAVISVDLYEMEFEVMLFTDAFLLCWAPLGDTQFSNFIFWLNYKYTWCHLLTQHCNLHWSIWKILTTNTQTSFLQHAVYLYFVLFVFWQHQQEEETEIRVSRSQLCICKEWGIHGPTRNFQWKNPCPSVSINIYLLIYCRANYMDNMI